MAQSIFDLTGNPELRTLLEEQMRRQQFLGHRFAQWMAPNFITSIGGSEVVMPHGPEGPKWTGAPIEMANAFIEKGRTDMLIPVKNRLTETGVYGGNQLLGTAERAKFAFRSVEINQTRKAYAPPTGMERQKTKQWATELIAGAHQDLKTWFMDFFPSNIMLALLAGKSRDLVALPLAGGRGEKYISHPNFFVAALGQVSYMAPNVGRPGTANYELNVEAALNTLVDPTTQGCTVKLIRNLVQEAPRAKIYPITLKSGFQFYPIWLKDAQWVQLQLDPEFQALAKALFISEMEKHPLGNGMVAYVAGAAIYVDFRQWSAYTNADDPNVPVGTVEYGPRPTAAERAAGEKVGNTIIGLDTGSKAMGFLIGQSCLTIGTGEKIQYTDEMLDHGNVKEVGINFIQSVVRNETFDTLGLLSDIGLAKGDFYENTSSLAFATFSPFVLSYT